MNFNNFTIKSREAIQQAFVIAQANNQQAIETGHLLRGLLHSAKNVSKFVFKKLVSSQACSFSPSLVHFCFFSL